MLETSIKNLPRTKPLTIRRLESIGIQTYENLLEYLPYRYEDFSIVSSINALQEGETVTVKGTIKSIKTVYPRRGLTIQKAQITDETGTLGVIWYNQRFIPHTLKINDIMSVSGRVKRFKNTVSLEAKAFEKLDSEDTIPIHTSGFTPLYPEKRGLSSRVIREKINYVLQNFVGEISEILPENIRQKYDLLERKDAFFKIHFPASLFEAQRARRRLSFDELFILQVATRRVREMWKQEKVGHRLEVTPYRKKIDRFLMGLPFELTGAQKRVIEEILKDLDRTTPMNRFLQGEVGSGKTVIAAAATYVAFLNGFTTLFMAPTEILAQQHYHTIGDLLTPHGVKVSLKTSSHKAAVKDADIVVGTQALLHTKEKFERVGLVIIDEQHRFGVKQRTVLQNSNLHPHLLTMTATPIPRTVALTLYGQLDVSTIDEMPRTRIPVKTYLVPPHKRKNAYDWVAKKIAEGEQVFIVCPLIEESDKETMKTVKAAVHEFDYLSKRVFAQFRSRLIHGKIKSPEKQKIMEEFKNHTFDILVSTPVVEVGIDIANATVMIIEGGERYGLAQLHQLRGRVGRGKKQSYCLVFSESENKSVLSRLNFFAKNNSGMELAEYDLRHRGAGELYGTRQHGLQFLKIADPTDFELVQQVSAATVEFLQEYAREDFAVLNEKVSRLNLEFIGPN